MTATTTVGTIQLIAKIDTGTLKRDAQEVENSANKIERSFDSADQSSSGLNARLKGLAKQGLRYAATGFAAFATTIATMTIQGGISRALKIEDAQAKLRGLGNDADSVKAIMASALDAVRGTAFGLDTAATMAAGAIAAGIKPGQELTKYLKTAADAATITGSSMEEMGSIFNKVQSSNKAYNDSLQQLADRGLPIYQWLSKELKVSTDRVFELASEGKISSEKFRKAIEDNIAGAALQSGATTRGAWANMLAAMSRIGERLVTGPISKLRTAFGDVTKFIDGHSDEIVGSVDKVISIFHKMGDTAKKGFNVIKSGNFQHMGEIAGSGIADGFLAAMKGIKMSTNVVKNFFEGVDFVSVGQFIVTKVIPGIAIGLLSGLGKLDIWQDIIKPLSDNIGTVILGALSIGLAPSKIIAPLIKIFGKIPIIGPMFNWLIGGLRALAAPVRDAFAETIGASFTGAYGRIGMMLGTIKNIILAPIRNMFGEAAGMVYLMDAAVKDAFVSMGQFVKLFFENVRLNSLVAFQGVKEAFSPMTNFFRGLWDDIIGLFGRVGITVGNSIASAFRSVINSVINHAVSTINGFIGAINGAISIVNKIPRVNISKLSMLPVPQLADGGIVTSATLSVIGEGREPEAVIPLSKLDQMLSSNRNSDSSAGDTYHITVQVSGTFATSKAEQRKVAEIISTRLQEVLRSKGKGGQQAWT